MTSDDPQPDDTLSRSRTIRRRALAVGTTVAIITGWHASRAAGLGVIES